MKEEVEYEWIDCEQEMPEFQNPHQSTKVTDTLDVKYSDGSEGRAYFQDDYMRSRWLSIENGLTADLAWSGKFVTHWKQKLN
jgi:hypothetical protein